MRKWIPLCAAMLVMLIGGGGMLAAAAPQPPSTVNGESSPASELERQAGFWIQTIAKQKGFQDWLGAKADITPIGPGQHGWLVTLRGADSWPVGYLIIHAKEEGGFQLGEYGAGRHPVFDPNTLYTSMVHQGLIASYAEATKRPLKLERLYVHPLLAVWKWTSPDGQVRYLDAWTAEELPITDKHWKQAAINLRAESLAGGIALMNGRISTSRTNEIFDAYERMPWLTKKPIAGMQSKLLVSLLDQKRQIRFTSELYDKQVLFVWPAIGYHRWDDDSLFVSFDQYGSRFIPMAAIQSEGLFFND
ncbi:hypothetical protein BCM02_1068 [Paenibacillus methanolicus]|uniref:Uncharacterized protein n=2 Tax=Paenibacillus methanolicus TaxID=582686 RepID=A0A5S5C5H4_9BACL|nr:hypothetical protein BCM02_1068 [Paenibacillus methanolicus]